MKPQRNDNAAKAKTKHNKTYDCRAFVLVDFAQILQSYFKVTRLRFIMFGCGLVLADFGLDGFGRMSNTAYIPSMSNIFKKGTKDVIAVHDQYNGSWWPHDMETFSALMTLCEGSHRPSVLSMEIHRSSMDFPHKRLVIRSFDVSFMFIVRLNKLSNSLIVDNHETPWHRCDAIGPVAASGITLCA